MVDPYQHQSVWENGKTDWVVILMTMTMEQSCPRQAVPNIGEAEGSLEWLGQGTELPGKGRPTTGLITVDNHCWVYKHGKF